MSTKFFFYRHCRNDGVFEIFIRETGKVLIVLCLELFSKWQRLCRILWSVLDSTDSKRSLQIKVPIL